MSSENVRIVRDSLEAYADRGLDGMAEYWDDEINWRAIEGAPDDVGEMHGPERLRRYFREWVDMFEGITNVAEELVDIGDDRVLAVQRAAGRAKLSGAKTEIRFAVVYTLRDGKIVRGREYIDRTGPRGAVGRGRRPPSGAESPLLVIVLGIDPGTANTGYGVVVSRGSTLAALDGGVIETRSGAPLERRLIDIHARVCDLIGEHRPVALAIEDLYFGRNAHSAFAVGQARGVVLLAAGIHGVPCFSYTPQAVKQAVCGSGSAAKDQVQRMVGTLLSLAEPPQPDHAADALAVAICHANGAPLKEALG